MQKIENIKKGDHLCYLLFQVGGNRTYMGYTNNIYRRIRQHNKEIKGGAKYTSKFGPWSIGMIISGFENKIEALRFEYMMKHIRRNSCGKSKRTENVFLLCSRDRWSHKSVSFSERNIQLHIFDSKPFVKLDWIEKIKVKVTFH